MLLRFIVVTKLHYLTEVIHEQFPDGIYSLNDVLRKTKPNVRNHANLT